MLASTSAIATVALVVGVVWNTSASPQQITGADGVPSTTASFSTEVPPTTLAGTGPWSAIPVGQFKPITGATVVWTGTEAMMIGGTFADGTWAGIHAYNPTTLTWRVVEASFIGDKPIVGDNPLVFWSGTLTFLIGASESTGESMVVGYDSNDGLSFRQQTGNADFVDATVPWAWTGAVGVANGRRRASSAEAKSIRSADRSMARGRRTSNRSANRCSVDLDRHRVAHLGRQQRFRLLR